MAAAKAFIASHCRSWRRMITSRQAVINWRIRCVYACALVLVSVLFIINIEAPKFSADAKKLKNYKLKDLKKLKEYAYLAAGVKKKFYAIPFPLPLPVFIKRQHIYTQVPIIPRYVDHPKSGSAYSAGASVYEPDTYEQASSSSYAQDYQVYVPPKKQQKERHRQQNYYDVKTSSSNRYIRTLAAALGSNSMPLSLSSQKDIISKLITGQAKVLPPMSLLSKLKSPIQINYQDPKVEFQGEDANYLFNDSNTTIPEISSKPSASHSKFGGYRIRQNPSALAASSMFQTPLQMAGIPMQLSPYTTQSQVAARIPQLSMLSTPVSTELLSTFDPQIEANAQEETHVNQIATAEAPQVGIGLHEYGGLIARPQQDQLIEALERLRAQQLHQRQRETLHALAREQYKARIARHQRALLLEAQQLGLSEQVVAERLHYLGY